LDFEAFIIILEIRKGGHFRGMGECEYNQRETKGNLEINPVTRLYAITGKTRHTSK